MNVISIARHPGTERGRTPPSRRGRLARSSARAPLAVLAVLALIAAAVALRPAPSERTPVLEAVTVTRGPVAGELRLPARTEPLSITRVGTALGGRVVSVAAPVGAKVKRGQVLARLDDLRQRASLFTAEAQLAAVERTAQQAEHHLHRIVEQTDSDVDADVVAAEAVFLRSVAQLARADAAHAVAGDEAGRRVIRSPTDGVIVGRSVEAGETIDPSPPREPLFTVASHLDPLRIVARIDEADAARLRPATASVLVPSLADRRYAAQVRQVALRGGGYEVWLEVGNPDGALMPGMPATVTLEMASPDDGLRVPSAALVQASGAAELAVVDGAGRISRRPVRTGLSDGRFTEIHGDLAPGARVMLGRP